MDFAALLQEFAARRAQRLNDFDDEIRPIVEEALGHFGEADWFEPIVEGAGVLWSEIFSRASPTGLPGAMLDTFLRELRDSLRKTAEPSVPPTDGEINRVARWVGVYAVNSATYFAGRDSGGLQKTWITMHDDDVRSMHAAVDGATVDIMGTFDVGGVKMHFPGEPVGSPEHWINCRCILAVAGGIELGGKSMTFKTAEAEVDEETGGELYDGEPVLTDEEMDGQPLVDDTFEVPWHGVLVVEGKPTGDKRMFEKGSLTYRDLPLPISWQRMSADGHSQSVVIGRIDRIERVGDEMRGWGMLNPAVPEANEYIDGLVFGMLGGVSVDVDDAEFEIDFAEPEDDEDMMAALFGGEVEMTRFTKGRICGVTGVNIPAFQEAYAALGEDFPENTVVSKELSDDGSEHTVYADGSESWGFDALDDLISFLDSDEAPADVVAELDKLYAAASSDEALVAAGFAPGTHDGPGWVTHPKATQRLRSYWVHGAGAAKIRWGVPGDFNRCRAQLGKYVNPAFLAGTCANLHQEALKVWPGREGGQQKKRDEEAAVSAGFALIASASVAAAESVYFSNPNLVEPTLVTVEGDHIFGHLAAWGTCHIGIGEKCVMPPHSPSDYYYAHRGITEDDGVEYATSPLIMGTGHANIRVNAMMATKHYDDTGYAIADVVYGEDAIGIWFSGKLRDDVDEQDLKVIKASSVSGDWRDMQRKGVSDELLGAIVVNVPGFPIPKPAFAMDGDRQLALVASAGILRRPDLSGETLIGRAKFGLTADDLLMIGRQVADEIEYREQRAARLARLEDPELDAEAAARREARLAAVLEE